VKPSHLEAVTHYENIRRGSVASKTHCINGHEFTPSNTHIKPDGARNCRACDRDGARARYSPARRAARWRARSPEAQAARRRRRS